jgi:hypothetical protein
MGLFAVNFGLHMVNYLKMHGAELAKFRKRLDPTHEMSIIKNLLEPCDLILLVLGCIESLPKSLDYFW